MSVAPVFPEAGPSSRIQLRPSTFELLAQEQLRDLLHPVVRYILTYFAQRYPRYLLRVLNHHEEFFACLLLLLERHHLKKHNASLSEYFYQLRLVPTSTLRTPRLEALGVSSAQRRISRRQRWGILVFLVGVPYVRARAQDYYERLGGTADPDVALEEPPGRAVTAQRWYRTIYPYANLGFDLSLLGYDLAYLFDKTDYYRPWHRLLGLRVERRGPDPPGPPQRGIIAHLPPLIPPLLLLLKLSQWWYSPSSPRTLSALTADKSSIAETHAKIVPPRPLPILPSSGLLPPTPPATPPARGQSGLLLSNAPVHAYQVPKDGYGKCPLCGKTWQNPAVLPSGWVVCWRCGWEAVEGEEIDDEADGESDEVMVRRSRKGKCPITGVDVGPGELRKVLL